MAVSVGDDDTSAPKLTLSLPRPAHDDADGSGDVTRGDVLTYLATATNSGNVPLTGVTVGDALVGGAAASCAELALGESCAWTGTYTVTQADVDAGQVTNTATARATGVTVVTASRTTAVAQQRALTLALSASPTSFAGVEDTITYTYQVTNSGTVTLRGAAAIADDTVAAAAITCGALPAGGLGPGGTVTCTAGYATKQADVDAGDVTNTATATLDGVISEAATATVGWTAPQTDPPVLSVGSVSIPESAGPLAFAVTLSRTSLQTVTARYATADDTATAGVDYTAVAGTLSFAPGTAARTIAVAVHDDRVAEAEESFTLTLSEASNATLSGGAATLEAIGSLTDDDQAAFTVGVSPAVIVEDGGVATVTVSTGGVSFTVPQAVTLTFEGTATEGTDYTVAAPTLTLAAGQSTVATTITASDDEVHEGDETVAVSFATLPAGAEAGSPASAEVTVIDDDAAPEITSAATLSVAENETEVATLTATDADLGDSALQWSLPAGEAGGADAAQFTLTPAGMLAFTAPKDYETPDDADADREYELTVQVSDGHNPVTTDLTVTLTDVQPTVTIAAAAASVAEGEPASFTVTRSADLSGASTVAVDVSETGAVLAATEPAGTREVQFTDGSASASVQVATTDDDLDEADGTVTATLTTDAGYAIGAPAAAQVTVSDDDPPPELSIAGASGDETDAALEFMVSLINAAAPALGSGRPVIVAWATADGTAAAGADYTAVSGGTLTFAPGETGATLRVTLADDALEEDDETFTVTLSAPADPDTPLHATLTDAIATGVIRDDEELAVSVAAVAENVVEGTTAQFTVTVGGGTGTAPVAVSYTVGGTATPATDYTAPGEALTLAAGAATGTIGIATLDDGVLDPGETLEVTLSGATTATRTVQVSGLPALTTIVDQGMVTASVAAATAVEGEEATFTVTLSGAVADAVELGWTTEDDTATAGVDYTGVTAGALTIVAGRTTATLTVETLEDPLAEGAEMFAVTLAAPSTGLPAGVSLGIASATGTIEDDDASPEITSATVPVAENETRVAVLAASDADGDDLRWNIPDGAAGGPDRARFALTEAGALRFVTAPDYETPDDAGGDRVYELMVQVTDGHNPVSAELIVTLTDVVPVVTIAAATGPVTEGAAAEFTVTRNGDLTGPLSVSVTVGEAGAVLAAGAAGARQVAFSGTAPAVQLSVATEDDDVDEPDATVTAALTEAAGYTVGTNATGTVAVTDDDAATGIRLSAVPAHVSEGDGATVVTVQAELLGSTRSTATAVTVSVAGSGADEAVDFTAVAGFALEIAAQSATGTAQFTLAPEDDTRDETDATVTVSGTMSGSPALPVESATVRLTDDDATPKLTIGDAGAAEHAGPVEFLVELSAASGLPVSVAWATAGGTATEGADYTGAAASLRFAPGETRRTISVALADDRLDEADEETFTVTLSEASNATLAGGQSTLAATGTIRDDEELAVSVAAVAENVVEGTTAQFTVTVGGGTGTAPVAVSYAVGGTATPATDYTAPGEALTLTAGAATGTIAIATLADDVLDPDETLEVTLSGAVTGARPVQVSGPPATATIVDDGTVTVTVATATAVEGEEARFAVTLSGPVAEAVELGWSTADGTAAAGADYTAVPAGALRIVAGQTTGALTVATLEDLLAEGAETFTVTLAEPGDGLPAGVELGTATATGTIEDDDAAPVLPDGRDLFIVGDDNPGPCHPSRCADREITVAENQTEVAALAAGDADGDPLAWNVSGGADAARFVLSEAGALSFVTAPDYEVPDDADGDRVYELTVQVSDGVNANTADVTVRVTDVVPVVTIAAAASGPVPEGQTAEFTVTRSGDETGPLSVTVTVSEAGSVLATGEDGARQAVFSGTAVTAQVGVATEDDAVDEPDATVTAALTAAAGYTLGTGATATVTVSDDDQRGLAVSEQTLRLTEGDSAGYTVALDSQPTADVTVTVTVTGDGDVTTSAARLTFTATSWNTAQAVTVSAAQDGDAVDDTATIGHLANGGDYAQVSGSTLSVTVDDDDTAAPELTLSLPRPAHDDVDESGDVTLGDVLTYLATATNSGNLPLTGVTVSDVLVGGGQAASCAELELGESCALSGTYMVTQADVEAGQVTNTATASASEASEQTASRTTAVAQQRSLALALSASPTSFAGVGDSITYSYQVTNSGTVTLRGAAAIADDTVAAAAITCGALPAGGLAPGGTVSCTGSYTVTQADVDAGDVTNTATATLDGVISEAATATVGWTAPQTDLPVLSVGSVSIPESAGPLAFRVTLSRTSLQTVTARYATADDTATAGADYTAVGGTLSFAPGAAARTITVAVHDDRVAEADESFTLTLSEASNATLSGNAATLEAIGYLTDDDQAAFTVAVSPAAIAEAGGAAAVTVSTGGVSFTAPRAVTLAFGGTATEGTDYTVAAATLTLAAGQSTVATTITAADDQVQEGDETVAVSFATLPEGTQAGSPASAVVTISDDDAAPAITSAATLSVAENQTEVATLTATDADLGDGELQWSIPAGAAGGADAGQFDLTPAGLLSFRTPKDYESPDDADVDRGYELTVRVSDGHNPVTAELTVTLTDVQPTVTIAAVAGSVMEGEPAEFTVARSGDQTGPLSVTVTVSEAGSVLATGQDGARQVAFSGTAVTVPVSVATEDDAVDEPDAMVRAELTAAEGYLVGAPAAAQVTVSDDDPLPELSIAGASGDEADGALEFAVSLLNGVDAALGSGRPVSVAWATADGTATAGADYTAVTGNTLTIAAGETGATLRVTLADDGLDEADETFTVTLSAPLHATLSAATATGTIRDDEELAVSVAAVAENVVEDTTAQFEVTVGGGTGTAPVAVSYAVGGTATPGTDYVAPSGTLTLAAGAASGTIGIATLADGVLDPGETLQVALSGASTATRPVQVSGSPATATIVDAGTVTASVAAAAATEGEEVTFTVKLSGAVAEAVELGWSTADGTAAAGADYTAVNAGALRIVAGQTTGALTVATLEDLLAEGAETFTVTLAEPGDGLPAGVELGTATATGTIEDDDAAPVLPDGRDLFIVGGDNPGPCHPSRCADREITVAENQTEVAALAAGDADGDPLAWSIPSGAAGGVDAARFVLSEGGDLSFVAAPDYETPDDADGDRVYELTVQVSDGVNASTGELTVRVTDVVPEVVIAAAASGPVPEGQTAAFTVTRSGDESGPLSVTVTVSEAGTVLAADAGGARQAVFSATAVTVQVGVATEDDDVDEPDATVTAALTAAAGYTLGTGATATVTVSDDDQRGLAVSEQTLRLTEGDSAGYTVALDSQPTADVSVALTVTGDGDVTTSAARLTFTATSWNTAQAVTVSAAQDGDAVDDTATIGHLANGGDYAQVSGSPLAVTVDDDDSSAPELTLGLAEPAHTDVDGSGDVTLGDELSYTATATNSGNLPLTGVTVSDALVGGAAASCATLALGESCAWTGSYTVTQADVEAGQVTNTATARATGVTVVTASRTTAVAQQRALALAVSASPTSFAGVGDSITYSYQVTNSGTVTLRGAAAIADDTVAAAAITCGALPAGGLAPGGTVTCTAGYATKQADVDAGDVTNTATATLDGVTSEAATATVGWTAPQTDLPVLSVGSVSIPESAGPLAFRVTLSRTSLQTVTARYATADDTATAGADYTAVDGTLSFTPGTAARTITVAVHDDRVAEAEESFTLTLSEASNATLSGNAATLETIGYLTDDDHAAFTVAVSPAVIAEAGGAAAVTVSTGGVSFTAPHAVTLAFGGTATEGADYMVDAKTLTLAAGQSTVATTITATDDQVHEGDETVAVSFAALPAGTAAGSPASAMVTISDDDPPPELSIAGASGDETDAALEFMVSLINAAAPALGSGRPVIVAWATADGTAAAGADYTAVSGGTLTFAPGETGATLRVTLADDALEEDDETFTVTLSAPADPDTPLHATLTDAIATGEIRDDEELAVSVAAVAENVVEGTTAQFTVTVGGGTGTAPVAVSYTVGGTATPATDYTAPGEALTLAAGAATGTIAIATLDDGVLDPGETLQVALSGASTAARPVQVSGSPATATIVDAGTVTASVAAAAATEGEEVTFTVKLSGAVAEAVELGWSTADGTAAAGADYTAVNAGALRIVAGQTTGALTVATLEDLLAEGAETFTVTLAEPGDGLPAGVELGTATATGTIEDDDAAPVLPDGRDLFIVGGDNPGPCHPSRCADREITVAENQTEVAALAAGDADGDPLAWSIPSGAAGGVDAARFVLSEGGDLSFVAAPDYETPDDADADREYELTVQVSDGVNASTGELTVRVTDVVPEVVIAAAATGPVSEGQTAEFTVTRSGDETGPLSVTVTVSEAGSVLATGEDGARQAVFSATAVTAQVGVATEDDDVDEPDATVSATLAAAVGYTLGTAATATVTVTDNDTDDDQTALTVSYEDELYGVGEGFTVEVAVTLSRDPERTVTIPVSATAGLGVTDSDYAGVPASVVFDAGRTRASFTVAAHQDRVAEANETVTLGFGPLPEGVSEGSRVSAQVSIADDDARGVAVSPTELELEEGESGSYTVVLESQPTGTVTVAVTEPAAAQFTVDATVLTFTAESWETAQMVTVTAESDADEVAPPAAKLTHAVSGADYAGVTADAVTVNILERVGAMDRELTLSVTPAEVAEDAGSTPVTLTGTLNTAVTEPAAVTVTVSGDTASAADFAAVAPVTLTVAAGQTTGTASFTLTPVDDALDEADETLTVSGVTGLPGLAITAALLTIRDEDERGVKVHPTELMLRPGDRKTYRVRLTSEPSEPATVEVQVPPIDDVDLTVEPQRLTFMPADWRTPQTVTVTAGAESATTGPLMLELAHAVSGGDYDRTSAEPVAVSIADDPPAGDPPAGDPPDEDPPDGEPPDDGPAADPPVRLSITAEAAAVEEGRPARFTVTRTGAAAGPLTVPVRVTERGGFIAGVPPTQVTIAANEATATLLVATEDDATDEPDGAVTATLAAGGLVVLDPGSAAVTVTDNDTAPALSIADVRALESAGELRFTVRLAAASGHPVTVTCTSTDGTATAGQDYVAELGTLTLEPGQTSGTIRIELLDDMLAEADETFTMVLSDPTHATLADAVAIGTIEDDDAVVAQAWLARFGRTVAMHAMGAVDGRLTDRATQSSQATVAGRRLEAGGEAAWSDGLEAAPVRTMAFGEVLAGSSFAVTAGADDDSGARAGGRWTVWGRGEATHLAGRTQELAVDGDVGSGIVGADYGWGRMVAGLAAAYSGGGGRLGVRGMEQMRGRTQQATSWLLSVYPYARVELTDRLAAWGLLGYGRGRMELDAVAESDVSLAMGAFGGRGLLLSAAHRGGGELAMSSDGFVLRIASHETERLPATVADVQRVRLLLDGSVDALRGPAGVLTPAVQVGVRYDGGDAETGAGLEVGGGVRYAYPAWGLTVEAHGRWLITHQERGYQEWGAGGSLRVAPGTEGRGPSLSLTTTWGAAASGVEQLWSQGTVRAGGAEAGAAPAGRLTAELAYGVAAGADALLTPYARVTLADGSERAYRLGGRLDIGQSFSLDLEADRRDLAATDPEYGLRLGAAVRW